MKKYIKMMMFMMLLNGSIGDIYANDSWWASFFGSEKQWNYYRINLDSNTDLKSFGDLLRAVAKDQQYHGILIVINNRGGSASYYSVIHDMVRRITTIKPVVALIMGDALSGGYWIASAADYVFAHSASSIGSIGVIQTIQRWSDVQVENGHYKSEAKIQIFKAGKYKALEDPLRAELSQDERQQLQQNIEKQYQEFIASVARNRKLDIARADEWADGKEFIASEALSLGLIDEIGTIFEAEIKLVELLQKKYGTP